MSATYLFCESYVQLENALFVVEQNYRNGKTSVIFIEENADLLKLFEHFRHCRYGELLDIVHLPYIRHIGAASKSRLQHLVKKIFYEKRYLEAAFRRHFGDVKGANIYFFCRPFNPYTFYMLKRLVKNNSLTYVYAIDKDAQEAEDLRTESLSILLKKIWLKLIYGKGLKWVKFSHGGAISTYIDDSFMAKVSQHITRDERKKWLKGFTLKDLSFVDEDNYHVVFYDTPYDPKISNKDDYRRTIEDIFTVLLKHFNSNQILIKYHPAFEKSMDLSSYGRVVPDYMPGQWFQKEGVLLLGLSSTCIINASAGYSVSFVNLVKHKYPHGKDSTKAFVLGMATCNVLLPETLEDLEKIVASKARNVD